MRALTLRRSPTDVGRTDQDINIRHPTVSRQHARLVQSGATWRIVDRDSTNGVHFEGQAVEWQELASGDVVWCGGVQIHFFQFPDEPEDIPGEDIL